MVSEALKETCQYYCEKTEKTSYFAKHLEAVLLGLIYARFDCEKNQDYNWHVVLSDVHDVRESHMHTLNTSYSQITHKGSNISQQDYVKSADGVDTLKFLRYHHSLHATFKASGNRRLNVVVWNQKYEAGGVEQLWRNGFRGVGSDWWENMWSLQGASIVMFILMAVMLIFGGKVCQGVNDERKARNSRNAVAENETHGFMEATCQYQDLAVGQVAIAVLILAVMK